jgi:hypothetical protein
MLVGAAVPFNPYAQPLPAVPVVLQARVVPLSVALAVPLTGAPEQVAEYATVAVDAPVGVMVQVIAEHAPVDVVVVDRHVPVKALIAGVVVGVVGESEVD